MSAHTPSWRSRAIGLLIGTFIIMMIAAVAASSGFVAVSTNSVPPLLTVADDPPAAPTNLTATALSPTEIGLSWTNPSGSLTDNHVYVYSGSTCSGSPTVFDLGSVYTSYGAAPMTPSTSYSFEVTASNSGGEGPPSNCATATTPPAGAPTGLTATALSPSEIGLSWTNPSGLLTDNKVYIYSGSTCSGSPTVIDLGGVYTSYADTSVSPTTNYSFEVTATTYGVEGPPSNCASATTPPPGAPTGLVATTASAHRINLSWTNPWETLTTNTVYEYSSGCSTLLETYVIAVATTYTATGLKSETTYCFTVSASMAGGAGPQSASASAMTRPSAPTGLTATPISTSEIDLTWTNPSGTLTDSLASVTPGSSCSSGFYDIGSVVQFFPWGGLAPATTYSFEVEAVYDGSASAPSACVTTATLPVPPAAPTGLTVTSVSSSEIDLTWTNPSGTLTDNYASVTPGTSCSSGFYDIGSVVQFFPWGGLAPATTYSFDVEAVNAGGASAPSACATTSTLPAPPAAPTGLTVTPISSSEIDLTWTNPSGTLTDNYASVTPGSSCSSGFYNIGSVVQFFPWGGLAPATTYSFDVEAVSAGGASAPSACVTTATLPAPPAAPTGLTVTPISSSEVDLSWTNPSGALTDSLASVTPGTSCSSGYYDIGSVVTFFAWGGLAPATTYSFAVYAVNSGGTSAPSTCVTTTTLPSGSGAPNHAVASPTARVADPGVVPSFGLVSSVLLAGSVQGTRRVPRRPDSPA